MTTGDGEPVVGGVISESVQDYLKSIYKIAHSHDSEHTVTTSLLAERMDVSAASATNMIKKLADMRLVVHTPYQGVELSDAGEKMALEIIRHHRLLELYLSQALGFAWDQVDAEADRLEHAISEDFEERIDQALGHPRIGAHGEPIPTRDGDMTAHEYVRLSDLSTGDTGRIRQVSDRDPELLRYLHEQGLVLGRQVHLRDKAPFDGPLLIAVESDDERHIGLGVADNIFVDLEPAEEAARS